jgi:hypothetical protein
MTQGIFTMAQQLQGQIRKVWSSGNSTPYVEYLVVAGGGGGGETGGGSGGGGGGGLLQGIIPVVVGISTTVTVGSGGAYSSSYTATGSNGNNSIFGNILAYGGGGGGSSDTSGATVGANGGSGGGATGYYTWSGGFGIPGQGNAGGNGFTHVNPYTGGGGGGAGSPGLSGTGSTSGAGGQGIASAISGVLTAYAGGGAGGMNSSGCGPTVTGGTGGGGSMPTAANSSGNNGSTNTGGGASGGYATTANQHGGTGGSGIVILSYPDTYNAPSALTGTYTASTSGSGSMYFNGSSAINYSAQSNFAFGTNAFTIEFWVYTGLSSNAIIFDFRPNGATNGAYGSMEIDTNGQILYYANSAYQITSATGVMLSNTWQHVALARSGTSTKLFVNGTQVGSTYTDSTTYLVGTNGPRFGSGQAPSAYYTGYISNLRVVNGSAVYTTAFTPSTVPLTPITNTVLLLGTVSPNQYLDSSTNAYTPTVTGSPTWNQLSPFATGLGYKNRVYTWTGSGTVTF